MSTEKQASIGASHGERKNNHASSNHDDERADHQKLGYAHAFHVFGFCTVL
jgi:hypothetical protein